MEGLSFLILTFDLLWNKNCELNARHISENELRLFNPNFIFQYVSYLDFGDQSLGVGFS
jgi:hypothetical protein